MTPLLKHKSTFLSIPFLSGELLLLSNHLRSKFLLTKSVWVPKKLGWGFSPVLGKVPCTYRYIYPQVHIGTKFHERSTADFFFLITMAPWPPCVVMCQDHVHSSWQQRRIFPNPKESTKKKLSLQLAVRKPRFIQLLGYFYHQKQHFL